MTSALRPDGPLAARALAWIRGSRESVADQIEPWEHGTVLRASRYPRWYDVNLVRVEDDPELSPGELISFADRVLAGLEHRMVSFEQAAWAEPLRRGFEAAGWRATRLVWMHHDGPRASRVGDEVRAVHYDAVASLRASWHGEDFPGQDATEFHTHAREVALVRGSRVLAMFEDGEPVAFAGLDPRDDEIEIGAVYVLPAYRGQGRGTALTRAAIAAAGGVEHLWICADADDRPQHLYARLGFRPVLTTTDFLKLPRPPGGGAQPATFGPATELARPA